MQVLINLSIGRLGVLSGSKMLSKNGILWKINKNGIFWKTKNEILWKTKYLTETSQERLTEGENITIMCLIEN